MKTCGRVSWAERRKSLRGTLGRWGAGGNLKGGNAFQTARAHAPSLSRGTRGEASAGILPAAGPGPGREALARWVTRKVISTRGRRGAGPGAEGTVPGAGLGVLVRGAVAGGLATRAQRLLPSTLRGPGLGPVSTWGQVRPLAVRGRCPRRRLSGLLLHPLSWVPRPSGDSIKSSLHVSTRKFAVSRPCSWTLWQENPHHGPLKQA